MERTRCTGCVMTIARSPIQSAKQVAARDRCDAMVRHACDQIMAVGVDRFSLNEVLRLSGGSKATLVKYFGDRNGLIGAAIGAEAERALAALALKTVTPLPLQEALEQMLTGVLRFYLLPGSIALYRAVISAADQDGSEGFYRKGHAVIVQAIASLLDDRKGTQITPRIDSLDVADQMLHAIRAGVYEQALIGLCDDPDDASIAARVRSTVALFLPALTSSIEA